MGAVGAPPSLPAGCSIRGDIERARRGDRIQRVAIEIAATPPGARAERSRTTMAARTDADARAAAQPLIALGSGAPKGSEEAGHWTHCTLGHSANRV